MNDLRLPWYKRIRNWWWRVNNTVFYWITLGILTWYIIRNWNVCISMQFFQNFNGNNILFLCWILMIFLKIFKIKVKDVEVFRNLQDDLQRAEMQHSLDERQTLQDRLTSATCDGGELINAQSED